MYVGGNFGTARPAGAAPGTSTSPRANFLAYDLRTGALLPFAPSFNAQVRAVAASPDGSTLYVGGQFTSVDGTNRYRLAAFDLTKSPVALKTGFAPNLNSSVYDVAATDSTVYAVGIFTTANGQPRTNAAAFTTSAGILPFSISPAGGTVRRLALKADGSRLVVGGTFTSMNGSSSSGFGMALFATSNAAKLSLPVNSLIRNGGSVGSSTAGIQSLAAAADGFYGTGYAFGQTAGNLEGAFKADWDGKLTWVEDCHGDTYSIAPIGAVAYVAGHSHDCAQVGGFPDTKDPVAYHHGLAFTTARTGTLTHESGIYYDFGGQPAPTLLHWFPDFTVGTFTGQSQGPWHVTGNASYVSYGGEFTAVNGKAQQGLVRFARTDAVPTPAPNLDGPRLSSTGMGVTALVSKGSIRVSLPANYDRDNARLTYRLYRNATLIKTSTADSAFWTRPTVSWTDTAVSRNQSYSYYVTATDPFNNKKTSNTLTVTAR